MPSPVTVTAVAVVVRHIDALSCCAHFATLINSFVDASSQWDVPRAARHGLLHLLQYWDQQPAHRLTGDELATALQIAASQGHLAILQWAHTHPLQHEAFRMKVMNFAAFHGHLEVVQWLHEHRREGCSTKALDGAACCGHMDVVRWLDEHRTEGCTVDAMDSAAMNGFLDVVKYLNEHRTEGCTTRAMDVAAANGDLAMMEYLYANRKEGCTAHAVKNAARGSRFHVLSVQQSVEVLQWLYERYRELFTEPMLRHCVRVGPAEVVDWVRSLGRVDDATIDGWDHVATPAPAAPAFAVAAEAAAASAQ